MNILKRLIKHYVGLYSWKTNRKIIVIESDDWGSQRTPDKNALDALLKFNPSLANDRFTCLDSIARQDDLSLLFEVLTSVKDKNGNPCTLTANVCVANPDFKKIKDAGFYEFFFEEFDTTIKRYPDGKSILELWQQGLVNGVFKPQLHGREHVHALAWLHELQAGNRQLTEAFHYGVWGIPYVALGKQRRGNLLAALDIYGMQGEEAFQSQWITDSARIFEEKFGYASDTFIPPTYIWHKRALPAIKDAGISGIQGLPLQYQPVNGINAKYKKKLHITGTKSNNGITKIARNAFFEPASKPQLDWVDTTLSAIKKAFDTREPAIIGSHRINYIGSLDKTNRDKNLKSLGILLASIVDKWPDVEFLTSDVLLNRILDSQ